jgi:hypothetical protein
MPGKLIHRTFSIYRTIKATIFRMLMLGVGVLAAMHFNDNPVLTSLVFAFCLLIFITAGDHELSVYEDRITISGGKLGDALRRRNTHRFDEINSISISGNASAKEERQGDIIIALPGPVLPTRRYNLIKVTRTDGTMIDHKVRIFRKEIDEAFEHIPERYSDLLISS